MKTTQRSNSRKSFLLALFAVIFSLPAFSQTTAFTYQGRLNSGASAASGIYDLTFSVFPGNSGGPPVAGPVTNTTAVSNGLFTVTLDLGRSFSLGRIVGSKLGCEQTGLAHSQR